MLCCGFMGALSGAMMTSSVVLKRNLYADIARLFKKSKDEKRPDDLKKER